MERLKVIEKLNRLFFISDDTEIHKFIKSHINAQVGFIEIYLHEYPDENHAVLNEIDRYDFLFFPYERIKQKELNAKIELLRNELAQAHQSLHMVYASASYRLGHTILYEKKRLLNPLTIINKFKTLYKMGNKNLNQQP